MSIAHYERGRHIAKTMMGYGEDDYNDMTMLSFLSCRPEVVGVMSTLTDAEIISRILLVSDLGDKPDYDDVLRIIGPTFASEYASWKTLQQATDVPDMDELLVNPYRVPVPKDPYVLQVVCNELVRRATEGKASDIRPIGEYIKRLPQVWGVKVIKGISDANDEIAHSIQFNTMVEYVMYANEVDPPLKQTLEEEAEQAWQEGHDNIEGRPFLEDDEICTVSNILEDKIDYLINYDHCGLSEPEDVKAEIDGIRAIIAKIR